jgi:hypothetical protein
VHCIITLTNYETHNVVETGDIIKIHGRENSRKENPCKENS